ncbi:histidine kinase [uncultured Polaribacter sp.]|uniref:sensor histidine kinase n=1 Tax=uncultured Polaribacter sp. TaxID=174711 RepID=UPI00261303AE|nr:histidine kinase [uncultured Polaribacter sp.]
MFIFKTNAQENSFQKVEAFKEFRNYKINEITQDKFYNIWLATSKGVLKFDGVSITNFDFKIEASSQNIQTIFSKNDTLFIGKNKSLHLKTRNKLLTFDAKNVHKIFEYQNQIFIGSNQGMLYFDKDFLQPLKTTYNLDFSFINDITFFNNKFIVASNSGLWILDSLFQPKEINLISKGNYSSLLINSDKLFVVKNKSEIEALNVENKLVKKYSKNEITHISLINDKIYVASKNDGIDILNSDDFIFEKRMNKYNSNLNSNTIQSVFEDVEKNIFIATNNELYIKKNTSIVKKPTLAIADIAVNYVAIDSINVNSYNKVLQLKPNQNNISFLLQSVSISNPENIEFRYKLDNSFSPWNKNQQVNFASLKPGNYEFITESRFKNSTETTTKIFSFYIEKPIYKEVWFLLLCGVVLCLIFAGIVDLYIRNSHKKNQEKIEALKLENHLLSLEQKALQLQMNPHFIFNVLNGIKALGNSENKKEFNKIISQFSILLRSVLNNSRRTEVSLKEEIETLENYLSLEQTMSSKKFSFLIETALNNIDSEEILIPPMLVQPFVENAIKHGIQQNSSKGKINIIFKVKHRFLECFVVDNGIGIYQSQKNKTTKNHTSVALEVTQERIENSSKFSAFSVEEIKEKDTILGTKIWFKIPLKTDY